MARWLGVVVVAVVVLLAGRPAGAAAAGVGQDGVLHQSERDFLSLEPGATPLPNRPNEGFEVGGLGGGSTAFLVGALVDLPVGRRAAVSGAVHCWYASKLSDYGYSSNRFPHQESVGIKYQVGNFGLRGLGNTIGFEGSYARAVDIMGLWGQDSAFGGHLRWATTCKLPFGSLTGNLSYNVVGGRKPTCEHGLGYLQHLGRVKVGVAATGTLTPQVDWREVGPIVRLDCGHRGDPTPAFNVGLGARFGLHEYRGDYQVSLLVQMRGWPRLWESKP